MGNVAMAGSVENFMDHVPIVLGEFGDAPDTRERSEVAAAGPGARLSCHEDRSAAAVVAPPVCRDPPLEILYCDQHLCAVQKPSGLLVHRSAVDRWETEFAVQRLRDALGQPVYPVHRLDKATSGVLLFALTREALASVAAAFEAGRVYKRYLAIVRGWPESECVIDHALTRVDDRYAADAATDSAQQAQTRLQPIATAELPVRVDRYPTSRYGLVALEPLTGRRHQLRRHLNHAGHPIIGDTTYGQGRHNRLFRARLDCHRLLLAAVALDLEHPASGLPLALRAAPTADFARVALALGWDAALLSAASGVPGP